MNAMLFRSGKFVLRGSAASGFLPLGPYIIPDVHTSASLSNGLPDAESNIACCANVKTTGLVTACTAAVRAHGLACVCIQSEFTQTQDAANLHERSCANYSR